LLGEIFSIYFKDKSVYENTSIIISFAPVSNLNNEGVAYIVHYEFGTYIDAILKKSNILFLLLSALALLLSAIYTILLTNEKKKQQELHDFAVHDALTGIYNRHGINELVAHQIDENKRDRKDFSVIFFDIDFFKQVNDRYGHDMGDYVLVNIARLVGSEVRESDIFARWGGEEFILFLPKTKIENALSLAEKLRQTIEEHAFSDIEKITCSFGVTTLSESDDKTSLLKRVDTLLYEAKESGRNCVKSDHIA